MDSTKYIDSTEYIGIDVHKETVSNRRRRWWHSEMPDLRFSVYTATKFFPIITHIA
jgi:hypothetical protein